jgi:hypothetical protein
MPGYFSTASSLGSSTSRPSREDFFQKERRGSSILDAWHINSSRETVSAGIAVERAQDMRLTVAFHGWSDEYRESVEKLGESDSKYKKESIQG